MSSLMEGGPRQGVLIAVVVAVDSRGRRDVDCDVVEFLGFSASRRTIQTSAGRGAKITCSEKGKEAKSHVQRGKRERGKKQKLTYLGRGEKRWKGFIKKQSSRT